MPNPIFPSQLKPVVSKGYGFEQPAVAIEQPVAGGLPLMMLDYRTALVPFDVVLVLTSFRLQVWQDFYFGQIARGTGKFEMQLDSGNGLETNICNLVPSSVRTTTDSSETWIVAFTVLAENTAAQDVPFGGNLAAFYEIYGEDLPAMLGRIGIFALNDIPEEFG